MRTIISIVVILIMIITISCKNSPAKNEAVKNGSEEPARTPVIREYSTPRGDSNFFSFLNLDYPGLESVKKYVLSGDFAGAKEAYLKFRREISKSEWNVNPDEKPARASSAVYPEADHILKHIIPPSQGAPEAVLGEDINWNYNPVDSTAPHYSKEWTWQQLNRMRQWTTLGQAYWSTLNEKYAREWVAQMTDWVDDNPVPLNAEAGATMAWRTIESGIRMAGSWMNSYYYFINSPSFSPEAHTAFLTGVIEHAQRLEKITLEHPERSTNWVAMECNGLGTIGVLFPELKISGEILKVAFDRLYSEMESQVYPDGAQTELAPGYHQVSRNNFMALANIARLNNTAIPEGYFDRIRKMYEYNLYMMDPSGNMPPFNDSRRTNVIPTLREAYEIWKDPEFLFGSTLGKEGNKPAFDSYYFNWAGYYVMRSGWNYNDNCLYFDAGPVGFAHEHEDMLNLYLYSKGKILLTEPGNYSYDLSEWRRYALSTRSHNTIVVDGKEQYRREFDDCRKTKEPFKNPWITLPSFDYGRGIYDKGYQATKYKPVQGRPREYVGEKDYTVSHTRHVVFLKPYYYLAVDFLEGKGKHVYDAHFNFDAPDVKIDQSANAVHSLRTDSIQLSLFSFDNNNINVRKVIGQESPILGWLPSEKRPIPTVVISKDEEAPAVFSALLFPYSGSAPVVTCTSLLNDENKDWAKLIGTPFEDVVVVIRKGEDVRKISVDTGAENKVVTDAALTIIRRSKTDGSVKYGFYKVRRFKDKNLSFSLKKELSFSMEVNGQEVKGYNNENEDMVLNLSGAIEKEVVLKGRDK